jgi:hypothetical protein
VVALTVSSVMVTGLRSSGFLTALRGEALSVPHDVDDAAKQGSLVGSRAWPSELYCPCRSAFDDAFSPLLGEPPDRDTLCAGGDQRRTGQGGPRSAIRLEACAHRRAVLILVL